jgi:hypothetical protein
MNSQQVSGDAQLELVLANVLQLHDAEGRLGWMAEEGQGGTMGDGHSVSTGVGSGH